MSTTEAPAAVTAPVEEAKPVETTAAVETTPAAEPAKEEAAPAPVGQSLISRIKSVLTPSQEAPKKEEAKAEVFIFFPTDVLTSFSFLFIYFAL